MSRQNWTLRLFCPVHLLLMQIPFFSFFSSYTDFLFSLAFWTDFVYNGHWLFCVKALNCETIRQ